MISRRTISLNQCDCECATLPASSHLRNHNVHIHVTYNTTIYLSDSMYYTPQLFQARTSDILVLMPTKRSVPAKSHHNPLVCRPATRPPTTPNQPNPTSFPPPRA